MGHFDGFSDNFEPGIAPVRLSPEPLGTEGEMTPGPDSLSPAVPDERAALGDQGYLDDDTQDDFSELLDTSTGTEGGPFLGDYADPILTNDPDLPF